MKGRKAPISFHFWGIIKCGSQMRTWIRPLHQDSALLQSPDPGTHFLQSSTGWLPHPQPWRPACSRSTRQHQVPSPLQPLWDISPLGTGGPLLHISCFLDLWTSQLPAFTSSMKLPQTNTNSSDYSLSVNSTQSCTVGHNSLAWTASFKLSQTLLKTIIYIFSVLLYWSIKKQLDTALMKGSLVIWIKKLNISSALWPQLYL